MFDLQNKDVLVIGLNGPGRAACELLRHHGAKVFGLDVAGTEEHGESVKKLCSLGVEMVLESRALPRADLVVVSPAVPASAPEMQAVLQTGSPVISELELGFQQTNCLSIAIAGTNGKATTAELVHRVFANNHRKTLVAGDRSRPVCTAVEQTKELDYVILQTNSFQLEHTEFFRPAVAVLLNLAPDHLDRYTTAEQYVRANARLFRNQQVFDWAIVQHEALERLRQLQLPVPGKIITFSASQSEADLYLDRGLIISRIPNWSGPLLDMDHCQLRGPHNAENLMAALAVGHVLRLPLESIVDPIKTYTAGPHRFELVGEINDVQFINDSKATNLDALQKALLATRPGPTGEANVWLIAGGRDKGLDFHDVGPLLSKRVKRAFLIGEASERIRAAWSLFTPCTTANSLLEAVAEAARSAASGDVVLLSPACSSFDQFRNYQQRGEIFCSAVKSIGRGVQVTTPHMNGKE
jgi:UDP-N-acetylmuramoylalanine--D-glutamate ligase